MAAPASGNEREDAVLNEGTQLQEYGGQAGAGIGGAVNKIQKVFQMGKWANHDVITASDDMSEMGTRKTTRFKNRFNKRFQDPSLEGIGIGIFLKRLGVGGDYAHRRPGQYQQVETNKMWLMLLDGQYSNEISLIRFYQAFNLNLNDADSEANVFKNQLALMQSYTKFSEITYKFCSFDFKIDYTQSYQSSQTDQMVQYKSSHEITIRNSFSGIASVPDPRYAKRVSNQCLPNNVVIKLKVNNDQQISKEIRNRTPGFTFIAGAVLIFNILLSKTHAEKIDMILSIRIENSNHHGQNLQSYPSQFSLFSHFLLLLANFLIFFIFFELSMIGVMNSMFFLVMIMHFCNSFAILGANYISHVKIMAYDNHRDFDQQQKEVVNHKCLLYIVFFFLSIFILNILMSKFWITLLFGSIWLPQIRMNIQKNQRGVPNFAFAVSQTVNILLLPLYMNFIDGNFMYLRPNYTFGFLLSFWLLIQLCILLLQHRRPRFMLPQQIREQMQEDYHRYEQTFEDDAQLSSCSFISDRENIRSGDFAHLSVERRQELAAKRFDKMTAYECIICNCPLAQVDNNPDSFQETFFKTPCKHRFHKECLLRWIDQKSECPICRTPLPQYIDPQMI